MKIPFTSQLSSILLMVCMSLGFVAAEVGAGERIEFNQFNFGPLSTRALFPGVNTGGPGVQQTDWYPVYLWRLPSDQCSFYLDPPGISIPFTDDHNLVTNVAPSDPTFVLHNLGCPLTVVAWGIYENEYDPVPRMTNLKGNVPVYFVHSSDVDNSMTWGDLKGLLSDGCALEGSAELSEILQGDAPEGVSGGAQVPSFKISLKGYLTDGTLFSVHTVGQIVPSNPPGIATVRTYQVKGLEEIEQQCQ
jgi:hypothetical protein